jgi:uncharacterized repeat protein (TIGR01451 family)
MSTATLIRLSVSPSVHPLMPLPPTPTPINVYIPLPALSLVKNVDTGDQIEASLGRIVTYTLSIRNNGEGLASGVIMTDPLPLSLTFGEWVEQGTAQPSPPVQWGPYDIAAHNVHSISFTARVTTNAAFVGQAIVNTAHYAAANAPPGSDSISFTVNAPPTVLGVSPPHSAQDVALDAAVVITFNKAISAASLSYDATPSPLLVGGVERWRDCGDVGSQPI